MAKHKVKFSIPERELGKADIEFQVHRDGQKIGTLKVPKGAIVWVPKDHTYGRKVSWREFDEFMREQPKE